MSTTSIPHGYQHKSLLQNTKLVLLPNDMDNDEQARSIRFPQWLWDEIDRDAKRCDRSSVKQMKAVLTAYYRGETAEINHYKIELLAGRYTVQGGTLDLTKHPAKQKTGTNK